MKTVADYKDIIDKACQAIYGHRVTAENTAELTLRVLRDNIPGTLVECGVAAGSHPAIMARIALDHPPVRQVHLFDSFCGIPKGGQEDDDTIVPLVGRAKPGEGIVTSGVTAYSLEQVGKNLRAWGLGGQDPVRWVSAPGYTIHSAEPFYFHQGWFQDTVPVAARDMRAFEHSIAILRLDGDLYESNKVCMDHLYPLLSPGGYCIIDDWALTGARKAVNEALVAFEESPVIHPIVGGGGPVWWQKGSRA